MREIIFIESQGKPVAMSTAVGSYASLLDGMWAPEGSEVNERLKKLQELERIRKERETKRNFSRSESGVSSVAPSVGFRSRIRSREEEPAPTTTDRNRFGIRRTMSHRGSNENITYQPDSYGGARPKFTSLSDTEPEEGGSLFSGVTASILGTRSIGKGGSGYNSYSRSMLQPQKKR